MYFDFSNPPTLEVWKRWLTNASDEQLIKLWKKAVFESRNPSWKALQQVAERAMKQRGVSGSENYKIGVPL